MLKSKISLALSRGDLNGPQPLHICSHDRELLSFETPCLTVAAQRRLSADLDRASISGLQQSCAYGARHSKPHLYDTSSRWSDSG